MRFIILALNILIINLPFNNCSAQINNCDIVFLDPNNSVKNIKSVTLEEFKSDTLTYSDSSIPGKIDLNDLIVLKYITGYKSYKGALIGASIGLAIFTAGAILLSGNSGGHPNLSPNLNAGETIASGLAFVLIGGSLGMILQHKKYKSDIIFFSRLSESDSRKALRDFFMKYAGKK